ncbi:MAG: hypothetical protein Q9223_003842 [Gallowayella weberi]
MYASRQGGKNPFSKDLILFAGEDNIVSANDADHSRMRRLLSHAFSDKALREQEPIIQTHVNNLMAALRRQCQEFGGKADLAKWFNWTTFDVIGDLAFGEPFGCLKETTYQPWVAMMMNNLIHTVLLSVTLRFPPLDKLAARFVPRQVSQDRIDHHKMSKEKVERRLDMKTDRPDFMSYIIRHNGTKGGMSREEIHLNSAAFIAAGSETTATLLSGAVWSLLLYPNYMRRLQHEVRSKFLAAEDIKLQHLDDLDFLHAVITESFRMYPPGVAGQPRVAPPTGDYISGYWVPPKRMPCVASEGVSALLWMLYPAMGYNGVPESNASDDRGGDTTQTGVQINQYAAYMSRRNFSSPWTFAPSRWMNDPQYASDKRDVLQPFSVGARSCIGKNLANAEIALVLARLVWEFDIFMSDETDRNWSDQLAWFSWKKKPLVVNIKEHKAGKESQ